MVAKRVLVQVKKAAKEVERHPKWMKRLHALREGLPYGRWTRMKQETYKEKIIECADHLMDENDSFSAEEVTREMVSRGYLSPMDTVLDIQRLLVEIYGEPDE